MGKIKIHQPHDSYIKTILSDISLAKSLMEMHMPKAIVKRIDWDSVQLTNKSFVSEELKHLHSDVIYKCTLDQQQGYIYYLVEHQSTPDKWLPVRLAEYNIQLLRQHINQGHTKLPIIMNEIIYAGKESPYNQPTDIFELFENPALAREIMQKPPKLTDLTTKTQEELLKEGRVGLFEVLMKQGIQRDDLNWENWIKDNIPIFYSIINETFGFVSLLYILATAKVNRYKKLINFIKNIVPDKKKLIMTAALQLRQEGIKKGIKRGIKQGIEKGKAEGIAEGIVLGIEKGKAEGVNLTRLATAMNMLQFGISKEDIVKITGLTREEIDKNCTSTN